MNDHDIRPLRAEDLARVKAVIDSTALFPSELMDDMAAPFLAGAADAELWFVAAPGGTVSGVAYCAPERMTDGTWNLLLIAVHQDSQGQGLGAALTRKAERTLAEQDVRVLLVETSGTPAFERTRAVYRQLGYAEEACIRDYYAEGDDKVVFWKALNPGVAGGR
jgi:ribosomal protein S18 acetylase RimI-like enzyme